MHCPGGNATDAIWRVLASSDRISSWTPLKPQHSNSNPLANQLWCIDFLTPPTPLIIPHRLSAFLESLMTLKNDARFMKDGRKAVWSIPYVSVVFFPSLKQNFIAYHSFKVSDCIFEIHQLWQSGFSRVYSNCCCSCSFEREIIKIGQSSHKIYSNNNFQECTTILNACTKKSGNLLKAPHILWLFIIIFSHKSQQLWIVSDVTWFCLVYQPSWWYLSIYSTWRRLKSTITETLWLYHPKLRYFLFEHIK